MNNITGYHRSAHFKVGDIVVYFRMQPPRDFAHCHHIDDLHCSKASSLTPEYCKTVENCPLLEWKDRLFRELGIHGPTLLELDKKLRGK